MNIVILILILTMLAIPTLNAIWIKRRKWTARKKKFVFSALNAFLLFPIIVPAETIIFIPHIALILLGLIDPGFEEWKNIVILLEYYLTIWHFVAIGYLLAFGIFRMIAAMVFFERPAEKGDA